MSSFEKFNKGTRVFEVDLKEVKEWKKAKDLIGKTVKVIACGTHPSKNKKYGDSVFLITDEGYGVNLPTWYADTMKEIVSDKECTDAIKSGTISVKFNKYETENGESVGVEWIEEVLPY